MNVPLDRCLVQPNQPSHPLALYLRQHIQCHKGLLHSLIQSVAGERMHIFGGFHSRKSMNFIDLGGHLLIKLTHGRLGRWFHHSVGPMQQRTRQCLMFSPISILLPRQWLLTLRSSVPRLKYSRHLNLRGTQIALLKRP